MADMNETEWVNKMKLAEEIRRFSALYVLRASKGSLFSAQEIDALFRIALKDGLLNPLELSREMGVSKPIVSRLLDQLHTKGVLEKKISDNDRRSYSLKLTLKGHDTLISAYQYYNKPIKILEEKLGAEQFKMLFELIGRANEP